MDKLSVCTELGGMFVKCDFGLGLNNIDLRMSGTGKTFLFSLLKSYMLDNDIVFKSFNYDSSSNDVVVWLSSLSNSGAVALLDNADLYLDESLRKAIECKLDSVIFIVSLKRAELLPKRCKYKSYRLCYTSSSIVCTEV